MLEIEKKETGIGKARVFIEGLKSRIIKDWECVFLHFSYEFYRCKKYLIAFGICDSKILSTELIEWILRPLFEEFILPDFQYSYPITPLHTVHFTSKYVSEEKMLTQCYRENNPLYCPNVKSTPGEVIQSQATLYINDNETQIFDTLNSDQIQDIVSYYITYRESRAEENLVYTFGFGPNKKHRICISVITYLKRTSSTRALEYAAKWIITHHLVTHPSCIPYKDSVEINTAYPVAIYRFLLKNIELIAEIYKVNSKLPKGSFRYKPLNFYPLFERTGREFRIGSCFGIESPFSERKRNFSGSILPVRGLIICKSDCFESSLKECFSQWLTCLKSEFVSYYDAKIKKLVTDSKVMDDSKVSKLIASINEDNMHDIYNRIYCTIQEYIPEDERTVDPASFAIFLEECQLHLPSFNRDTDNPLIKDIIIELYENIKNNMCDYKNLNTLISYFSNDKGLSPSKLTIDLNDDVDYYYESESEQELSTAEEEEKTTTDERSPKRHKTEST